MKISDHLDNFEKLMRIEKGPQSRVLSRYRAIVEEFVAKRSQKSQDANLADVTEQDIESYCGRVRAVQAHRETLLALQRFFGYLHYVGVLATNPAADIPRPRASLNLLTPRFTREEINLMLKKCDGTEKGTRDKAILILLGFARLLVSEIVKLNIEDIVDANDVKKVIIIIKAKRGSRESELSMKSHLTIIRRLVMDRTTVNNKIGDPLFVAYSRGGGKPRGNQRFLVSGVYDVFKRLARLAMIEKPKGKGGFRMAR